MTIFEKCIQEAKNMGDELFPIDCLKIMKKYYKKHMDVMKPETLIKKVVDLMSVLCDTDYQDAFVYDAVFRWLDGYDF